MTANMADRDGFIWLDGKLVPWRSATTHVLTHALHYGSAVFEGERIYDGRVFRLSAHSARLRNSAHILDYELPSGQLIADPVFSIRARSPRPDGQPKTAHYDWPNLPPLGNDEAETQKALF